MCVITRHPSSPYCHGYPIYDSVEHTPSIRNVSPIARGVSINFPLFDLLEGLTSKPQRYSRLQIPIEMPLHVYNCIDRNFSAYDTFILSHPLSLV